jgi:hypothetical protein
MNMQDAKRTKSHTNLMGIPAKPSGGTLHEVGTMSKSSHVKAMENMDIGDMEDHQAMEDAMTAQTKSYKGAAAMVQQSYRDEMGMNGMHGSSFLSSEVM